jgi:hypothetical protein
MGDLGGKVVGMDNRVAKLLRQSGEHTHTHKTNKNKNINNKI